MYATQQKKNVLTLNVLYNSSRSANLQHHGILGMHWGIRRFQPYGQGYDPKNEGREIGLAARLAGGGSSYTNLYGKSAKRSAMDMLRGAGKKASRGVDEALERMNYANDRMGQAIKGAGRNARSALAGYAAGKYSPEDKSIYEQANAFDLAKGVFNEFEHRVNARRVSDVKKTSYDDIMSRLGSGASSFQSTMQKTKVASKDFSRNAKLTMAMLAGAADPRSSASQILEGRWDRKQKTSSRSSGATINPKDMLKLESLDTKKNSSEKLGDYLRRTSSPYEMNKMGFKELSGKYLDEMIKTSKARERDKWQRDNHLGEYSKTYTSGLEIDRYGRSNAGSSDRLDLKSRDKQLKDFGDYISNYMKSPNNQTTAERFMSSGREGLQLLDAAVTPAARGAKVNSEYFKNMSQMERRLLGF